MTPVRRDRSALVEAGLLALLGAGVLLDALGYPPPLVEGAPGPAFFPRLVAILLLGCAAGLALRSRRRPSPSAPSAAGAETKPPAAGDPADGAVGIPRELRRWGAALWIAAYLLALPLLGVLFALPALVCGLMWLSGERSYGLLLAVPLGFAGFLHLLFERVLGVPLP